MRVFGQLLAIDDLRVAIPVRLEQRGAKKMTGIERQRLRLVLHKRIVELNGSLERRNGRG